jgi:peptidoglycan-associated lipoprotein
MIRAILIAAALLAAPAAAQQPGYPPPGALPPGTYPPGPMLAIPVLQADLKTKAGSDTVRFGRDSYVLTPQTQANLSAQAQWLIAHPFVRASIEGHSDTRLTRDYALALGERRAAAVRNYLLALGVPPQQLEIVSWGKERPAVAAAHDATWLQNSRVVTVLKQPPQPLYPAYPGYPQQQLPPPPPPYEEDR